MNSRRLKLLQLQIQGEIKKLNDRIAVLEDKVEDIQKKLPRTSSKQKPKQKRHIR